MRTLKRKTLVRRLHESAFSPRVDLAFMLQDWEDPYNVGGLFRVADACGAALVCLTGRSAQPPHPQVSVTSMGHHRRVKWQYEESSEKAAILLRQEGWSLIAVEIADEAVSYLEFVFPERTCLVLGNEANGVYSKVMAHCDAAVFIPMAGKGRSMNVHVSAAVVAFKAILG